MNYVFVLGSPDPEMEEIESVLRAEGHAVVYASHRGMRVRAEHADTAREVSGPLPPDALRVFVECRVHGLRADVIVDHHRPGDPGYAYGPADYLKGSSLGQVLTLLGLEPTHAQRLIAAADHCPGQAYQGLCPGVCPKALAAWRTESRAKRRGVTPAEMDASIEEGRKHLLEVAELVSFNGRTYPWVNGRAQLEVSEASARYDVPFMYIEPARNGRVKMGIMGADPEAITAWMQECGLTQVYGNPHRGYAGGYVSA